MLLRTSGRHLVAQVAASLAPCSVAAVVRALYVRGSGAVSVHHVEAHLKAFMEHVWHKADLQALEESEVLSRKVLYHAQVRTRL